MEIRSSSRLARLKRSLVGWKQSNAVGYLLWLESLRVRGAWNLWRYDDRAAIIKLYRDYSGREPDLLNPVRFSEKLQWLKLHNRDPLQTTLADKHAVRGYLKERGLLDKAKAMQATKGSSAVLRALQGPLAAEKVRDFIAEEHHPHTYELVLLSGVGSAWPMMRGNNHAPPSPGTRPIFKNVAPKIALSDAMRISPKHATSLPRPMAGPLTAEMSGTSRCQSDFTTL